MPSTMNNKLDPMFSSSSSNRSDFTPSVLGSSMKEDYTRTSSVDSAGGSSLFNGSHRSNGSSSSISAWECPESHDDDINSLYSDDDCHEVVKQILQHDHPIRIIIKLHVTKNKFTKWESVLYPSNNILYVAMPETLAPEASKETLLSLLEFAEDKLEVDGVVMCVRKNRWDRARLLKSFLLIGFEPLSRKAPEAPPAAEKDSENFFLIYHTEDE